MSIARRRDSRRELMHQATAYPLPFTTGKIKALDKMDQKRRRALRLLVLSGVAVLLIVSWVFG
jgi:hypothetical protein